VPTSNAKQLAAEAAAIIERIAGAEAVRRIGHPDTIILGQTARLI